MPYIKQDKRKEDLDKKIAALITELGFSRDGKTRAGEITYTLYKILGFAYFTRGARYADMALGLGILDAVRESLEDDFKRPYEATKKETCGWHTDDISELGV